MQEQQSLGRDALSTDQTYCTCVQEWVQKCMSAGKNVGAGQRERQKTKRIKREKTETEKGGKRLCMS